jgi:hypothetical protein
MIEHYLQHHGDNRDAVDLEIYPFRSQIDDPELIENFAKTRAAATVERDPEEVLLSMRTGWSDDDIRIARGLSTDDFYVLFKKNTGDRLRTLIYASLQFDRFSDTSDPKRAISQRAKEALLRIGQESPLNGLRVARFGREA